MSIARNPSMPEGRSSRPNEYAALAAWIVTFFLPSLTGIFFPPGEWYLDLNKPTWNPPGWIFGPVWTCLYLSMGIAAWMIWKTPKEAPRQKALTFFGIQLILNAIWSPVFFGLHNMGMAFVVIIGLWLAIGITLLSFLKVNRKAGWMLLPYLLWVSFASFLNFTLWRMNS